jgi:hypothetical protein
MAKSVKVVRLLKDLSEEIVNVDSLLTDDHVVALKGAECEVFKMVGLVLSAYRETDLTEEQAGDLAKAEKALADLADSQIKQENQIRVDYLEKQIKAIQKAKPEEHGQIVADLDAEKALEIATLSDTFASKRTDLTETIRQLANVKILAAEQAVKDLYGFDGSGSNVTHTRPDIAGNEWLILDLCTRTDGVKSVRGQFYLDPASTLYFMPTGADWHKSQARPFKLDPDVWHQVCTFPADSLKSASYLQAVCHMSLFRIRERESLDDLAAYATGIVANDNVDMSSTGGSRSVWHVVPEKQDPGYARQVYGDKLKPYNLPTTEEPTEEPTTEEPTK